MYLCTNNASSCFEIVCLHVEKLAQNHQKVDDFINP